VNGAGLGTSIQARADAGSSVQQPSASHAHDLESQRLIRIFPRRPLGYDHFRLIFRTDDSRRSLYVAMAETMRGFPLK